MPLLQFSNFKSQTTFLQKHWQDFWEERTNDNFHIKSENIDNAYALFEVVTYKKLDEILGKAQKVIVVKLARTLKQSMKNSDRMGEP